MFVMSYKINFPSQCIFFIHIPKNAGNAILHFLTGYNRRCQTEMITNNLTDRNFHSTLGHALEQYPNSRNEFFFTVIRNPWHRSISWFFYRKNILREALIHNNTHGYLATNDNLTDSIQGIQTEHDCMQKGFNVWLDRYANHPWDNTWFKFSTNQTEWIDHKDKEIDMIIRQENFAKDYKLLMKRLGFPKRQTVYKIHKTKYSDGNIKAMFDDQSKKKIAKIFEKDIERFGFIF